VLTAAETGHLVFSTLHTNSAVQTVDRIVNGFLTGGGHEQLRQQLAAVLEAAVSLQLGPRADGSGLVAAVEILRRTPQVSKLIQRGDFEALREEIEQSVVYHRMQSMNQSLAALVIHGTITLAAALEASANPADLDLMIRKVVGTIGSEPAAQGENMAECTSDFSKILALTEIRRLYEELQERNARELGARDEELARRDAELAELRRRLEEQQERGAGAAQLARIAELEAAAARQEQQLAAQRAEYEGRLQRFEARLRELKAQVPSEPPPAESGLRGLFRR
jgi:twitching motility protein PilT